MFEERLAAFSRERLDGRPLPADLRTMLIAHWEGREDFRELLCFTFLEPEEPSPLLDVSYLTEKDRANPETMAVVAAAARLSAYAKFVAEGGKGWLGYWLHPGEPADAPPPLLELDTEFQLWAMQGRDLTEACAYWVSENQDDPNACFAELADDLAALGLPLSTRDRGALDGSVYAVSPESLFEEYIQAERKARGLHWLTG